MFNEVCLNGEVFEILEVEYAAEDNEDSYKEYYVKSKESNRAMKYESVYGKPSMVVESDDWDSIMVLKQYARDMELGDNIYITNVGRIIKVLDQSFDHDDRYLFEVNNSKYWMSDGKIIDQGEDFDKCKKIYDSLHKKIRKILPATVKVG